MKKLTPIFIDWKPDKNDNTPVYQQIVKYICDKIAAGEWAVGTQLPSQRDMAKLFDVNRSTISTAVDELKSYGIVEGSHGSGTRIISNTWSLMLTSPLDWSNYVESGFFRPNNKTIQAINKHEFDEGIIRLGTGEIDPRLFPVDLYKKVLDSVSINTKSLAYLEPLGLLELREALSKYLKTLGIEAPPSCILITSGSLQALHLISTCLLQKGSIIFTEAPSYLKSLQLFQSADMLLKGIPMDNLGLRYWDMAKDLAKKPHWKDAILYTIPTNHNPTGHTMPEYRREKLLDFCAEHQLPIIEDCAYQELNFDNNPPPTLKELDKNNLVINVGTVSKSLAPGMRVGWLIASEPIVQRLGDIKMQIDYGASSISQMVFTEFINSGLYEEYLVDLRKILKHRQRNTLDVLEKHFSDIAHWNVPNGGFYIWLTFNGQVDISKFFNEALKKNILLNPGDIYDFKNNNSIRLSYAYIDTDEMEKAIKVLSKLVRELSK